MLTKWEENFFSVYSKCYYDFYKKTCKEIFP